MTAANFQKCLQLILASEGGNVDDPDDPGGRTSRGVTQREYDAYRHAHPGLPEDVWFAPQSAVADIYDMSYWQPWGPRFPGGVDYVGRAGRQDGCRRRSGSVPTAISG